MSTNAEVSASLRRAVHLRKAVKGLLLELVTWRFDSPSFEEGCGPP